MPGKAHHRMGRRELLLGLSGAMGAATLGSSLLNAAELRAGNRSATADRDRKLLFVVCATGGASIVDSFLPVIRTEVDDDTLADTLNIYEDDRMIQPAGSTFRCPEYVEGTGLLSGVYSAQYYLETFLARHFESMTVLAQDGSSVNHHVAQMRSVNGSGINRGRTLMEAMAIRHGEDLAIPNCNMANGGFVDPGFDPETPPFAAAEVIASPLGFASAMDGSKGVFGAPDRGLVERARRTRTTLEDASVFGRTFSNAPRRQRFLANRRDLQPRVEAESLTDRLTLVPAAMLDPKFGVGSSPLLPLLTEHFPRMVSDPWQAQTALAVLLSFYGLSCSNTIGQRVEPVFINDELSTTPLAFDFSHLDHRVAQSLMWGNLLSSVDSLVVLLKKLDYLGDPELGKMWDRSLIYVATDFGREKTRPSGAEFWAAGHDFNNGTLMLSPLLKGNRIFGGVDPKTCRTVGFDPVTGGVEPSQRIREEHIYSVVAQALDIEFPERIDMSGVLA